ncbi:adenylate/guanylate cyclase domain-containing protein [Stappia indica]|uniref:adenylate/guanylate cyclase domain-containing protein n=1 Tax=Stappia indica TaxID=538381 RepID=UPI001CD4D555|nr:adenylate/guanylate cyclase domain-containing protein [Stappia indica]MCA1299411.1 adenylate/guanylate cyclase domain-containing protein [Stappia indica]
MEAAKKTAFRKPSWSCSLRSLLGIVMISLIIILSGVLISLDYHRTRKAELIAAEQAMGAFSERLADRLSALSADTVAPIELIAQTENAFLVPPPGRMSDKIAVLRVAMARSPQIDGLYAGYPDGSFVHAVSLRDAGWREALAAPEKAALAIRTIEAGPEDSRLAYVTFLDANGTIIGRRPFDADAYDPRARPWYQQARAQGGRTISVGPYQMATTRAHGMTVARAHQNADGIVIGADIILGTVTNFLAAGRLTEHTNAFILDDGLEIAIHAGPGSLRLASALPDKTANGWSAKVLAPLVEAAGPTDAAPRVRPARIYRVEDEPFLVTVGPEISSVLLKDHRIVVAAPLDELLASANRDLLHGVLISIAVVIAAILFALALARWISRSLQILTLGAHRMQSLDFSQPIDATSRVTEISTLGGAINRAQDAIFTFALYVPKEFVRKGIEAGYFKGRSARRQEVTAMFSDIYDFTTISENHSPEEVVEMLSGYFDVFDAAVSAHGGTIIQFLGDSVYAMWNAPLADEEHALHACLCVLDIEQRLVAFNAEQRRKGLPEFRTRYGIHSGPAVVGSVGATERLQYTAMGDTINVASRLEGTNKVFGTSALTSAAVVKRCGSAIRFRPLGSTQVKGRVEPLEVFELVGEAEDGATSGPEAGTKATAAPDQKAAHPG